MALLMKSRGKHNSSSVFAFLTQCSSAGQSATASSTSVETSTQSPATSTTPEPTSTPTLSPAELTAQLREKIASDLVSWKDRFASTSEKGVEGLEGRLVEIVDTYIAGGAQSEGDNLVTTLEGAVQEKTNAIKQNINALTESLPSTDAPEEEASAVEQLLQDVRSSALSIRDRAHFIREWHVSFEQQLVQKVSSAVNSTLAVLDNVRYLGLQEIGMRWVWMDGVTYKDWEDYHALKEEFEDWKARFREIGLRHARIEAVKDTAEDTLSRGMEVAEAAAKELARLKEVGQWKIAAREVSEDFDTRSEPPPPLPKPATDAEGIPAAEDEQKSFGAEGEASSESETIGADPETNPESPASENIQAADEKPDSGRHSESLAEPTASSVAFATETSQSHTETLESNPFGAAAAAVLLEKAAADIDDSEKLDHDEVVVDAEATKVSEAFSDSLGVEDASSAPTPSQKPAKQQSIESLLSHILNGTDPAFADKIMNRLHSLYETQQPGSGSSKSGGSSSSSSAADAVNEPSQGAKAREDL